MLHLEGEKTFARPRPELWAKLTDLQFLSGCIPDVSKVHTITDRSAVLTVRPGFSFVRGSVELTIEKLEEQSPESARFRFKGKGIGTSNEVEVGLRLEEQGTGTLLRWSADVVQLGGLLKAVPQALIRGAAQKVIGDLLARIEERLTAGS